VPCAVSPCLCVRRRACGCGREKKGKTSPHRKATACQRDSVTVTDRPRPQPHNHIHTPRTPRDAAEQRTAAPRAALARARGGPARSRETPPVCRSRSSLAVFFGRGGFVFADFDFNFSCLLPRALVRARPLMCRLKARASNMSHPPRRPRAFQTALLAFGFFMSYYIYIYLFLDIVVHSKTIVALFCSCVIVSIAESAERQREVGRVHCSRYS
jgi:hypothetical protein